MLCPIVTILFAVGSGIAKGKLFNSEKNRAATDPSVTVVVEQSDHELVAVAVFAELTSHVTSEQANKPEHGAMKKKMMMKMQRPKLFNYVARRMAKLSCTETMANDDDDDDDAVCLRLSGAGDVLGWLVERWFSVSPNDAAFSRTDTDGSRLLVRRLQQNENENGKKKKTGMIKEEEKEEKTSVRARGGEK
ncbi:hypothetical protein T06_9988 [Trichinella sp. T6]|nr:hypothetical protein T06_9988 [Trichinella sp. T6]